MIQHEKHGTFSPQWYEMTAKEYLAAHNLNVDKDQPIVEVEVCDPKRMGYVKFKQNGDFLAVEIDSEAKAVRHHLIKVAR